MKLKHNVLLIVVASVAWSAPPKEDPNASQIVELRKKIAEYKEKTSSVNDKINTTRSEMNAEVQADERYRKTVSDELTRLQKEKTELTREKSSLSRSADSLAQKISTTQSSIREFEYRQDAFNNVVIEAIQYYETTVNEFAAPLLIKEKESLAFLKRESMNKTISPSEAVERLWQVVSSLNKERLTIDVWQSISAWEKITGQVHYLRIGFAWLAMVNEMGTAGAVWNGTSWSAVTHSTQLTALRTAANVRSGNAIPIILSVPLAPMKNGVLQ